MEFISIFNDVLGPVMRGPSSSHTAGAYRIGKVASELLGGKPSSVTCIFDPKGSMAPTYVPLGVDLAFASGLMGWSMLDERYIDSLERASGEGVRIEFKIEPMTESSHPNGARIELESTEGKKLSTVAEAIGGGVIRFTHIDGWPVNLDGKSHHLLVELTDRVETEVTTRLKALDLVSGIERAESEGKVLLHACCRDEAGGETKNQIKASDGVYRIWSTPPVFFVQRGESLFSSAEEMITKAAERKLSLGETALAYETSLLGMSQEEAVEEMLRRYDVMAESVRGGLDDGQVDMLLLRPTASRVYAAEAEGKLPIGGLHTRAAARAMAVMHVCNSRGVVCAAPTGGSAGVVPGTVVTLAEEKGVPREKIALSLFSASAIGLIMARRATFAAEIAGCQVEIGVAGAMAAAAVVEAAGGSAQLAADAAAVALQNTMGSVCDPVQGACEVPCHTRNAVAASSAFVCADLVLGGYYNPVPLDETIDASFAVGKALPSSLRCTAAGGIAVAPSALSMSRLR
jgi:L-serine dehydratase